MPCITLLICLVFLVFGYSVANTRHTHGRTHSGNTDSLTSPWYREVFLPKSPKGSRNAATRYVATSPLSRHCCARRVASCRTVKHHHTDIIVTSLIDSSCPSRFCVTLLLLSSVTRAGGCHTLFFTSDILAQFGVVDYRFFDATN